MEMLPMTDPLRSLVMKHANAGELRDEAIRGGMLTMYEDGLRKAVRGITTFEEVLRVTRESLHERPQLTSFALPRGARRPPFGRPRRPRPEAMPVFRYKAVNPAGDVAVGELEAANESEIVDRLRDQGMLPMQVAPRPTAAAPRAGPRVPAGRARAGGAMVRAEDGHRATICWR